MTRFCSFCTWVASPFKRDTRDEIKDYKFPLILDRIRWAILYSIIIGASWSLIEVVWILESAYGLISSLQILPKEIVLELNKKKVSVKLLVQNLSDSFITIRDVAFKIYIYNISDTPIISYKYDGKIEITPYASQMWIESIQISKVLLEDRMFDSLKKVLARDIQFGFFIQTIFDGPVFISVPIRCLLSMSLVELESYLNILPPPESSSPMPRMFTLNNAFDIVFLIGHKISQAFLDIVSIDSASKDLIE